MPARRLGIVGMPIAKYGHLFAQMADVDWCVAPVYLAREEFPELTAREMEVLGFIVNGLSNKDIAHLLENSPRTVEAHRSKAMLKLHARNTADLVRIAVVRGNLPTVLIVNGHASDAPKDSAGR
jgi:DNA-binding CsgD family transcriptional regulator